MLQHRYLLFVTCLLFLLVRTLFSQYIVEGTVWDNGAEFLGSGAEPVKGAYITITDQTDTTHVFSGYTNSQGHYSILISQTTVENDFVEKPEDFRLWQNYPNPFNHYTIIGYELTKAIDIKIEIYSILGQTVKTLINGYQTTSGQVIWDASDDLGHHLPPGMYICSMTAGLRRMNKKLLLLDGQQIQLTNGFPLSCQSAKSSSLSINGKTNTLYMVEITGINISRYEQKNIEITSDMAIDFTVICTLSDIDGNLYKSVKIGDQWWMAENLKAIHYRNGDEIHYEMDDTLWMSVESGAYCNFDHDENLAGTYGRLYNWYAVNDSRGLAPAGWHVPSDEEWKKLEICLGMTREEADLNARRGANIGAKLKEAGVAHWNSPNVATNESGFCALPAGDRYSGHGKFVQLGNYTLYWTSSEADYQTAWYRLLQNIDSRIRRAATYRNNGFSVRCVKNDLPPSNK